MSRPAGYSPLEMLVAGDITKMLLDYWARTGLLAPALPDGRYTADQLALGLVLADASRLGAPCSVLAAIALRLAGEPASWPETLYVTAAGVVLDEDSAPAAWLLHPRRQLAHAGPSLMLALAS